MEFPPSDKVPLEHFFMMWPGLSLTKNGEVLRQQKGLSAEQKGGKLPIDSTLE